MTKIKLPSITNPIFTTNLSVRIYDLNYGNHLGNDSLLSLIHEARVRFFKQMHFTELDIDGVGILITNLVVHYKAEAFYGGEIQINIGLGEISKTGVDLHYELQLKNKEKNLARALTTCTFFDYKNSKVTRVPPVFLQALNNMTDMTEK
jgi:acyl-CoA thioester hydrolase